MVHSSCSSVFFSSGNSTTAGKISNRQNISKEINFLVRKEELLLMLLKPNLFSLSFKI